MFRDLKELPEIYNRRAKATSKLEAVENTLLKTAAKIRAKEFQKAAKDAEQSGVVPLTVATSATDVEGRPLTRPSVEDPESDVSQAEQMVPQDQRPSHRLPLSFMPFALPFVGEKVDTIDWARDEIVATNELLAQGRARIESQSLGEILPTGPSDADSNTSESGAGKSTTLSQEYPPLNSAFITFNSQIAAHMAKNALNHHDPYRMTGRYAEVAPEDVIWGNLGMNAYEGKVRMLVSYGATAGLIILWAFPGKPHIVVSCVQCTN